MRVSDIIAHSRDLLQDWDDEKRYSDESLIRNINMCLLEIRRVRPDAYIGTYDNPAVMYSKMTSEVQIPETFMPSIIKYITGMAELRDDEYTTDGRAAALLQAFTADLGVR